MAAQTRRNTSAGAKKSNNTKKTTAKRSAAAKKNQQTSRQNQRNNSLRLEIFVIILFVFSILLGISNFGRGGMIGDMISKCFFGLFGWTAYIFPIYIFFVSAYIVVNRKNPLIWKKIAGLLLSSISFCGIVHLFTYGYAQGDTLTGYYRYSSLQKTAGGVIGGGIVKLLAMGFGTIGAAIILGAVFLISLIIATQHSILRPLKNKCEKIYLQKKERHIQKKIQKQNMKKESKMVDFPDERIKEKQEKKSPMRESGRNKKEVKKEHAKDTLLQQEMNDDIRLPFGDTTLNWNLDPDKEIFGDVSLNENNFGFMEEKKQEEELKSEENLPEKKERHHKNPKSSAEEISKGIENIQNEIEQIEEEQGDQYIFPPLNLLKKGKKNKNSDNDRNVHETALKLQNTLHNFGVNVTILDVSCGPTVTRYELQPEQGVKVSKIVGLTDDIKLNLAAADIRIEAPIPGKAAVGIEVPNKTNSAVMLRDLLESEAFEKFPSELAFAVGKDIAGKTVVADIGKMPHLLIAGATGSGKSVCINTLIMSILYKATPEEVKLIMIDPKVVELSVYNGIPHLFIPVVTDPKKAAGALNWAVSEMTERYNLFAEYNVRDLKGYNKKVEQLKDIEDENKPKKLPKIVIIVDELADLMMVAPGEVEDSICRLAQLARAAGIHLIIATQRPSVNVITGLIKANMPSRIAFSVSSGVDSRTILDMNGAEKLLGRGDMLYYPQGYQKPARLQGAFVSDTEVSQVVDFLKEHQSVEPEYDKKITEMMSNSGQQGTTTGNSDLDAYFVDAGKCIIEKDKASIGMLQRVFKIGFNRAARIMDQLSTAGVVGPEEGTKPRKVLMTMEEFENYIEESM